MIITHCDNSDYVRLCEMSFLAQVGWWEANLATRTIRCSEYSNDLLGFDKEEELTFDSLCLLIRPDYRGRIKREFASLSYMNTFDQTYPFVING